MEVKFLRCQRRTCRCNKPQDVMQPLRMISKARDLREPAYYSNQLPTTWRDQANQKPSGEMPLSYWTLQNHTDSLLSHLFAALTFQQLPLAVFSFLKTLSSVAISQSLVELFLEQFSINQKSISLVQTHLVKTCKKLNPDIPGCNPNP